MRRIAALVIACAAAACGTDDSPSPGLLVSVFKDIPSAACRAQLPSDALAVPPDQLTFALCKGDENLQLVAGVDSLTLVIDYGGLEFAESTAVTPPTVTVVVAGSPAAGTVASVAHRIGGHVFFETVLAVPAQPGAQMSIVVSAATGFSRTVATSYAIAAPQPAIAVEECADQLACSVVAAVATVAVHITVAGAVPQMASLVSIVDGVSQPGTIPVTVATPVPGNSVDGLVFPLVPQGSTWSLQAVLGPASATTPPIELTAPVISATLACGNACVAGAATQVIVTAPRLIHPAVGSVNIAVAGAPLIADGTVALTVENVAQDTISGSLPFTFPATPGAPVVIDSLVAGYPATTISTALH